MASETKLKGTANHRVVIEFDGGLTRTRLIHPESGCNPATICASCSADLTDPEGKRCYDCPAPDEECWLTGWVEEQGTELLQGSIEFPVNVEWDCDTPIIHVAPASSPQLSASVTTESEES